MVHRKRSDHEFLDCNDINIILFFKNNVNKPFSNNNFR